MRLIRSVASTVLAGASLLALAAAPARAADAAVNVSLYWPSDAAHASHVFVPVGGTVKLMLQVGSDGGYSALVETPADPAVFTTSGPELFHTELGPGMAGGYEYDLWTFTAVAAGTTTFAVRNAQPWTGGDKGPLDTLTLTARTDEVAALTDADCPAGAAVVGLAVGAHVGIQVVSNASTGYTWTEVSVPNTVAFRPDEPQGVYTGPAADAPPGAPGYQTFGYTGLADGSSPIDLAYARAGQAPGSTCAPTISVGVTADPRPGDDTIAPLASFPAITPVPLDLDAPTATPAMTATAAEAGDGPAGPSAALAMALLAGVATAAAIVGRSRWMRARRGA